MQCVSFDASVKVREMDAWRGRYAGVKGDDSVVTQSGRARGAKGGTCRVDVGIDSDGPPVCVFVCVFVCVCVCVCVRCESVVSQRRMHF